MPTLTVILDGNTRDIEVDESVRFVDAMEQAGLRPPYSCRDGSCGTCMCTLEEGDVELHHNNILTQADINDGWIIACQAMARSPAVRIRFPD